MWNLPRPGFQPLSPALAGRFLSTGPPGKSCLPFCIRTFPILFLPSQWFSLLLTWLIPLSLMCICAWLHAKSCPTLCNPMNCTTPGFLVLHYLQKFAQTHVHWVNDAIQPCQALSPPSPVFNLSLHQGLFKWANSLYHMAKGLEIQLQSFQWIFRLDFL